MTNARRPRFTHLRSADQKGRAKRTKRHRKPQRPRSPVLGRILSAAVSCFMGSARLVWRGVAEKAPGRPTEMRAHAPCSPPEALQTERTYAPEGCPSTWKGTMWNAGEFLKTQGKV